MIKVLILSAGIIFSSIFIFDFFITTKLQMSPFKAPFVSAANYKDVILSWDRPNDDRVAGYKIFFGSVDTNFKSGAKKLIHSPAQTSCEIFGLEFGRTYGFAAKSINGKGAESIFSEVLYYYVREGAEINDASVADPKNHSDSSGDGCFIHCITR